NADARVICPPRKPGIDWRTKSEVRVATMAGDLEALVRKVFDAVDRKDVDALHRLSDDDIQGVDEVAQKWLRGRDAADEHWRQGLMAVEDIRTELGDFSETTFGEAGLVTYWMEQDYTLDGNTAHVSGP